MRRASATRSDASSSRGPPWCRANRSLISSLVMCTTGPTMWLGGWPEICRMYSPRSVSIGSSPCDSRNAVSPISSVTMLLLLVTERAPAAWQSSSTIARASAASRAQCTVPPRSTTLASNASQVEVEMGQAVVLDVAALVAQRLELGQPVGGAGPVGDPAGLDLGQSRLQRRILPAPRGRCPRTPAWWLPSAAIPGLSSPASPIAGVARSPASTSATWRLWMPEPSRLSRPAMFIRQPRSPASSRSAPVAAMLLDLVRDHPGRDLRDI